MRGPSSGVAVGWVVVVAVVVVAAVVVVGLMAFFLGQAKETGDRSRRAVRDAQLIAKEVADESLQIHGGYGLIRGSSVERFYRDQRLLQIGEGTSEILRLVISRKLGI